MCTIPSLFHHTLELRIAFIIATTFLQFVMNYFHHIFHSLKSLAEMCILFTWAIPFIMESFFLQFCSLFFKANHTLSGIK